ncbi:hypothetical protein NL676_014387 [Syzygium grande]|nr:hypothetical protein NL676_014387 [Syzygium grande]
MAETLVTTLHNPSPTIEADPTPIMEPHQEVLGSDVNKTTAHLTRKSSSVLLEDDRPLAGLSMDRADTTLQPQVKARPENSLRPCEAEAWTQVNRKKGKGQLNKATDQTRPAPCVSMEANPGEETLLLSDRAPTSVHGPSMNSSKAANAPLTRTVSVPPLDVNRGRGAPRYARTPQASRCI